MRPTLARLRWWQWALLHAAWFAAGTFLVLSVLDDGPVTTRAIGSAAGGVLLGAILGPASAALARWSATADPPTTARRHLPQLPGAGYRQATRAARGGPVPTDPIVLRVALETARATLPRTTRFRVPACLVFAVNTAVHAAITVQTPHRWWGWLLAAAFAVLTVSFWTQPERTRRRIEVLEAASGPSGSPAA
ncbi:hypothetical protein [Cellulomonas aerilata]|uniref:Uncharacterized protein n=1 Tax=Cellulomonas aerilata TaxID=515326 RepID=A0A512DFK4_9CELL|nr:hypothetical protein [Cellulomonas aerilata]GEO35279.1 hypothetical protein CAE01nite_30040 [Cellulomonas aerilata]